MDILIQSGTSKYAPLKVLAIFFGSLLTVMMLMSRLAFAADDGVPFDQELKKMATSANPPFSENFVAAFLADPRFSKYATTPPEDGTTKETFAKIAFGNYCNEQVSQAPTKTVSAADFKAMLDSHIDSHFSTAPEMALKAGLDAYLKEKYPKGLPDPMTFTQINNFLLDFSSWMKFTQYGKLGGKLNDERGVILPDSLQANVYNALLDQVKTKIRNGDYLPDVRVTTPSTGTSMNRTVVPRTNESNDDFIIEEESGGGTDRNSNRDQGNTSRPSTVPDF